MCNPFTHHRNTRTSLRRTPLQAKAFYAEHKERPFFGGLVKFMTSGEAVLMILQKDNAIKDWRDFMGPTNSIKVNACTPVV